MERTEYIKTRTGYRGGRQFLLGYWTRFTRRADVTAINLSIKRSYEKRDCLATQVLSKFDFDLCKLVEYCDRPARIVKVAGALSPLLRNKPLGCKEHDGFFMRLLASVLSRVYVIPDIYQRLLMGFFVYYPWVNINWLQKTPSFEESKLYLRSSFCPYYLACRRFLLESQMFAREKKVEYRLHAYSVFVETSRRKTC